MRSGGILVGELATGKTTEVRFSWARSYPKSLQLFRIMPWHELPAILPHDGSIS
ncbi:hypothetical protein HED49_01960 [Ochrobactrum daejeonense]|nr:hypothetical protein [Brucella daejeonensis]